MVGLLPVSDHGKYQQILGVRYVLVGWDWAMGEVMKPWRPLPMHDLSALPAKSPLTECFWESIGIYCFNLWQPRAKGGQLDRGCSTESFADLMHLKVWYHGWPWIWCQWLDWRRSDLRRGTVIEDLSSWKSCCSLYHNYSLGKSRLPRLQRDFWGSS